MSPIIQPVANRNQKIYWLKENRALWEKAEDLNEAAYSCATLMQKAGLYSLKTNVLDVMSALLKLMAEIKFSGNF